MKNILYLLRHAHVDSKGTLLGQTDVSLSDKGEKQAQYWQKRLQNTNFQAVWSSPLQRAVETGEIIMKNHISSVPMEVIPIQTIPAFTEISLGLWDGQSKEWIQKNDSKLWLERGANMECIAPPNGESFADLRNRVIPIFLEICEEAKKHTHSLLIAHQAVNRVILSHILRKPLAEVQFRKQDYACLNILDITDELHVVNYEPCPI